MINVSWKKDIPDNARIIMGQENGSFNVYFDDDPIVIEDVFREACDKKVHEIKDGLKNNISSGYPSSATGTELMYSLEIDDIVDINNLISLNAQGEYKASNAGKAAQFVVHTIAQLKQVRDEGVIYKFAAYKKHETLFNRILAASTVEEVELINW